MYKGHLRFASEDLLKDLKKLRVDLDRNNPSRAFG